MKQKIAFLFVLLFFSCSQEKKEDLTTHIHKKIDQWHIDAAHTNFESYFNFIAPEGVFIGTDVSERWSKKEFSEFSKPYFDKGKAWEFTAIERTIKLAPSNKIAWFDEVLETWMGECRATGILGYNGEHWKLEHYQLSVTIANDLMEAFLDIKK